ncbi:hypothetical protein CAEBREN_15477 [Caenorhabditis brenneri]|uniref:C2H2-type domain-containing protein n=1 Tax=Caenorhabditis brenneri TaxID=135651 RepID=G0P167_CAEBE|nr:hypothetical protein CAEBREN_15477 [Caenorhabditis brenneri]
MDFTIPMMNLAMDMSLTEEERSRRMAFYKKKQEMINENRMVLDCPKCLIIFTDPILYRMHISMHPITSGPVISWQCALCKRHCTDRLDFFAHMVKYGHSMIPQGVFLPPNLGYHFGLPDLSSLCPPTDLLRELVKLITNNPPANS